MYNIQHKIRIRTNRLIYKEVDDIQVKFVSILLDPTDINIW